MNEKLDFLVPDYLPDFSCKMGACRKPCCEGWPVTISMKDYFKLLSVDCSPELRRRLDAGLHLAPHPTEDAYAQITPRYDGQCPLHLPDGRCGLQAELGAGALAAVCRLYPRGIRRNERLECSCAASCEAVPEMFLRRREPLRFITAALELQPPPCPPRQHFFHTGGRETEIRLWLIRQLQNRQYALPQRMQLLGHALLAMDQALTARDEQRVHRLLTGEEPVLPPDEPAEGSEPLAGGLEAAEQMLAILDGSSNSIRDYGEEVLAYFIQGNDIARYARAAEQFAARLPHWETWFEHLLVNHMFFAQFPFQDRPVPLKEEYLALCAVYALLRFLAVGYAALHPEETALTDVVAAVFRLVEHTEFDRYAAAILRQLNCDSWQPLRKILSL